MKLIYFVFFLFISCLIITSCKKKDEIPTYGLLLYLPFNGNVLDASGNNIDCLNGTKNNYVPGIRGQALDFDGMSDFIQLNDTINSGKGLSFSFWIKTRGASGTENNGVIAGKYSMTYQTRCFLVYSFGADDTRSDNRLSAAFYKEGTSSAYHDNIKSYLEPAELLVFPSDPSLWTIVKPVRLVVGAWTHCVINVTSTDIEAWINGVLCTKKHREYDTYFNSPNEHIYIGNNFALGGGSNNHFNGAMDEFRIYNRGLTPNEIGILYKEK